jgi:short-subunit dehydrogenase
MVMRKVVVIFGAGPGLGASVARRFGNEGYQVALVGRRLKPLTALAEELGQSGIPAVAFSADLGHTDNAKAVAMNIQDRLGRIDAVYYAPSGTEAFLPAVEMTVEMTRERTELMFHGLVAIMNAVLPQMRQRGEGAILAGFGASAVVGEPFMSGPAPAQAAARNYLYSLHGEVLGDGVRVGMVTIAAVIKESAYYQSVLAGADDAPDGFEMPLVDPDDLAGQLWEVAAGRGELEKAFPSAES